jgi:hypothetical protein
MNGKLRSVSEGFDQVERWEGIRDSYPEASYSVDGPWFYGALRNEDEVMKAADLKRLIDGLLDREEGLQATLAGKRNPFPS